jgi:glycine cleavage system H protein
MTPNDRRYAASHEWVRLEGDTAVVGITDHAQEQLGDITFVELPEVGSRVEAGSECGVVESVKAASDIYTPVTGEIAEVNTALEAGPEAVNEDPYGKGWMFKLRGVDAGDLDGLLDAAGYEATL